jgi:hypothetical protein
MGRERGNGSMDHHMKKLGIALAAALIFAAGALVAQTTVVTSFISPLIGSLGGTGVANSGKTITLGGNLVTGGALSTSGAHALILTLTGDTNLTVPTSGALAVKSGDTLANLTVTGSLAATGLVTNADLANPATTVNGQTCTLGSTCTITASVGSVAVGTTAIVSGTDGRILSQASGLLAELSTTGSGNVVLAAGGALTGITGWGVRDTSAAFDVTIAATSSTPLTAGRTLTLDVVNGARTLKLGSNLTIASDPGAVSGAVKANGTGTFTQAACADLSNGATGCSTTVGTAATAATGTSGHTLPYLDGANAWSGPQRTNTETPTISTATFTPVFSTGQNHRIVLIHASCPCTLANPAALVAGQSGMFEVVQSSTGSDAITTWGSEYEYAGGTSAITLSTGANTVDFLPYYVDSSGSFIVLGGLVKGPVH